VVCLGTAATFAASAQTPAASITAVPGVRVGHFTLTERPTGCTVVLLPSGTVGGVDVRGGAPGTRETDVLAPDNTVEMVNAVVLAGGSAFGLDAATGVMKFLEEKKVGYPVGNLVVPIVPAAILFDLNVGGRPEVRPDASCGYQAMKGGIGSAALTTGDGLIVGAIVAVNAVGTVIDPRTAKPVAGVRSADGRTLEDPFALVRRGVLQVSRLLENTSIGVVVTNAKLTKAQARRVAEMAHDGLARAIVPAHTPSDGDTLFAMGTGSFGRDTNVSVVGQLAAEAVSDAILRAVRLAKGLPGFPSATELAAGK
jgi:L-aminopeptidase/D-esterase-like protein